MKEQLLHMLSSVLWICFPCKARFRLLKVSHRLSSSVLRSHDKMLDAWQLRVERLTNLPLEDPWTSILECAITEEKQKGTKCVQKEREAWLCTNPMDRLTYSFHS